MRKNDIYRPSAASLGKKKRVVRRKKGSSFFFKLIFLLFFLGICAGVIWAAVKTYHLITSSQISDWHVKTVAVSGVTGGFNKELLALSVPYEGKPFAVKDAVALRGEIIKKYPMLKDVSVKRGLLSGKLKVSAEHRTPLAKFVLPDKSVKYIDPDSTVYSDPNPDLLHPVPFVELEGPAPEKLNKEFIDLVESTLKLGKELDFAFLRMNLTENTVKMYMPDGSEIDFGKAANLKKKAARAAQIIARSRGRYDKPYALNFDFFEDGKVFLTQKSH